MKEKIHSDAVKQWVPELWSYLQAASDAMCLQVLGALIEYSLSCTEQLNDPNLLRIATTVRSGSWPTLLIECEQAQAAVEDLDREYLRVFADDESDRSPTAPWVPWFRRFTAGRVICCACIPDKRQAVMTAVFETFAFERIDGVPKLRNILIEFIAQHPR